MRPARARRLRRALVAVVAIAVVPGLAVVLAALPAQANTATSLRVSVEPSAVLEPYTPATFRAEVTPTTAVGTVTFSFDGEVFGTATVVGGQAVFETASHPVGEHDLRATFAPSPGSGFAPSTSSAVPVTVNAIARLLLSRPNGSYVAPGSRIEVGERISVLAAGYPAESVVRFTLAGNRISETIRTDRTGSGAVALRVSADLPSAVYQLVGQAGLKNAAFVFYVYNPPAAPATSTPVTTVPVSTSGGNVTTTTGEAPTTSSSGGPGLASTGADTVLLLVWGVLALLLGGALRAAGTSGPVPAPRHARR